MMISNMVFDQFLEEIRFTKVSVQFSDKSINGYPCFNPLTGNIDIIEREQKEIKTQDGEVLGVEAYDYVPFKLKINDSFVHPEERFFFNNKEYSEFILGLVMDVLSEIDSNIKLRIGKWDILDYLSMIRLKLNEIRSAYREMKNDCPETNCKKLLYNTQVKITTNDNILLNVPGSSEWVHYVLTLYWQSHVNCIDRILEYISQREEIIDKTDDYVMTISDKSNFNGSLTWEATDTDLLELITALVESGSIQNPTKSLTRKEAIEFFSGIFRLEIKDAESKLSRATERKKDLSVFLTKLKDNFERYAQKKDERMENIRK